jgi:hypothetical protein
VKLLPLPLLVLAASACIGAHAQTPRHLFLDPAFVPQMENVSLRVNPPQQREIVIRPDKPWEQLMISFFLTVREEEGKLRMWYICRDKANHPNLAYAESLDGVTWVKPNLGIVEYDGSKENNLVGVTTLEGTVFQDPQGKPEEKYLYVTNVRDKGIVRFTSPDGLRWRSDDHALLPFRADTQNVTLWDERQGAYVLYLRGWDVGKPWTNRLRKVVRLTTGSLAAPLPIIPSGLDSDPKRPKALPHFVNEIPTVFAADERDPKNTDVYNLAAQRYPPDPRWYVGFPSFFQRERDMSDGRLEMHFAGSADGITWHRYDRTPYVLPGLADSESANMVFMGVGLVVRGDEIWQYGTGFHSRHGDVAARKRKTDGVIYRYVQRVDGFVSLDFGNDEGKCVTAPVKADGARLLLNVDTGALGQLRVGLLDADGKAIGGHGVDECEILRTNSTRALVSWKGGGSLAALEGRDVRLTFAGSHAKLYSFHFEADTP